MSPEERKLLEKTYALAKENNEMLSAMRRSIFLGRLVRVLYWTAIIVASGVAYKAIQPYWEQVRGISEGVQSVSNQTSSSYFDLIKNLTN